MIFSGAIAAAYSTFVRKCPKCGARQKIALTKKSQYIDCRSCGASIPPHQSNIDPDHKD
jgi:ribosomal protein S27E